MCSLINKNENKNIPNKQKQKCKNYSVVTLLENHMNWWRRRMRSKHGGWKQGFNYTWDMWSVWSVFSNRMNEYSLSLSLNALLTLSFSSHPFYYRVFAYERTHTHTSKNVRVCLLFTEYIKLTDELCTIYNTSQHKLWSNAQIHQNQILMRPEEPAEQKQTQGPHKAQTS